MAGIYLHIPYCRSACTYCNFHFTTSLRYRQELVQGLAREAVLEMDYLQGQTITSIYFGGGTPSLLETGEISLLLNTIRSNYIVSQDAEVTLEANPDDIEAGKLQSWKKSGINRLSLGIQSFFEEELRWMNRAHSAVQARESLKMVKENFDNFTLDLIYGSPLLKDEMWQQNVQQAIDSGVPHLSCYALTVEEKTALHKNINLQKSPPLDNEKQARQFLLLMHWLREAGYEHYEVSNFALPGFRSRHNSSYWKGISYLGLGPSAHSYNGKERRWNVANNAVYMRSVEAGKPEREAEVLTPDERLNETIMIALRTMEGLNLDRVAGDWGEEVTRKLETKAGKYLAAGWMIKEENNLKLTDEGMLRADGIAASLFF